MDEGTLRAVAARCNEKIQEIQEDLGKGNAKDFAEYRYHCGRIRELCVLNGELQDMALHLYGEDIND